MYSKYNFSHHRRKYSRLFFFFFKPQGKTNQTLFWYSTIKWSREISVIWASPWSGCCPARWPPWCQLPARPHPSAASSLHPHPTSCIPPRPRQRCSRPLSVHRPATDDGSVRPPDTAECQYLHTRVRFNNFDQQTLTCKSFTTLSALSQYYGVIAIPPMMRS